MPRKQVVVQFDDPVRKFCGFLMKRFTRLSLGFSKKLENLEAACAMFLAYYNFVWRTRLPEEGRNRLPVAMMAGEVDTLWSFENLFDQVMAIAV